MIKIKTQKGFIQIPLLARVIISVIGAGGVGYGINEYSNVSKSINRAENLAKEEKYNDEISKIPDKKAYNKELCVLWKDLIRELT